MLAKAMFIWVAGLLTIVPYGTYYLLFQAQREEYAFLIVLLLFWVLGYWSVAGPLLAVAKVRKVLRAIEQVRSKDDLLVALQSAETRDVAIDLIASDNHIPRFMATYVYQLLIKKLAPRLAA
jgi:hypothetical protein